MTSFRSRCQVVSTELFPPVVVVPSAKIQFSSLGAKTYRHSGGFAGHFLELSGRYQGQRRRQIQFHASRCNPLSADKKEPLKLREYQKFPLSLYEVREESFYEKFAAL